MSKCRCSALMTTCPQTEQYRFPYKNIFGALTMLMLNMWTFIRLQRAIYDKFYAILREFCWIICWSETSQRKVREVEKNTELFLHFASLWEISLSHSRVSTDFLKNKKFLKWFVQFECQRGHPLKNELSAKLKPIFWAVCECFAMIMIFLSASNKLCAEILLLPKKIL